MGCTFDPLLFVSRFPCGAGNVITDVAGVKVGHCTLDDGDIKTGVTAIVPHGGNIFKEKLPAGCAVFNGFGKSAGLMQIAELGTLETPIILTNTLSVGTAYSAIVRHALENNADIGISTGTVNPVVCECNDSFLDDIRGMHITEQHVFKALHSADVVFEEGGVGAGCGMSCYGFKGGIGSASRKVVIKDSTFMVGALVLSNFGSRDDLRVMGCRIADERINRCAAQEQADRCAAETQSSFDAAQGQPDRYAAEAQSSYCTMQDMGSVIVIIATDAPLSDRQLNRVSRRAVAGLCRSGSFISHGSGEIAISFSTANRIPHYPQLTISQWPVLHESFMDHIFASTVESVEDAVYSSLLHASSASGVRGNTSPSLAEHLKTLNTHSEVPLKRR